MTKRGKKYLEAIKQADLSQSYSPQEAVASVKKMAFAKFDETVELHLKMGVDPRNSEQQVRGVAVLPHGLGKKVRVLVFTQGEGVKIAQEAGADHAGGDELIQQIEGGWLEFDVSLATPDMMGRVGKLGRILGRRGLMPNPRSGTVVPAADLTRAIADARKGRVEFRLDRTAIIHVPIGKVSFEEPQLVENLASVLEAVTKARPSGVKGQYIRSITLASTMGPGISLDLQPALTMAAA